MTRLLTGLPRQISYRLYEYFHGKFKSFSRFHGGCCIGSRSFRCTIQTKGVVTSLVRGVYFTQSPLRLPLTQELRCSIRVRYKDSESLKTYTPPLPHNKMIMIKNFIYLDNTLCYILNVPKRSIFLKFLWSLRIK